MSKVPKSLSDAGKRWLEHPAAMVRELFGVTPDPWQEEVLEAFPRTKRIAMKASKGPGKSACLSWLAWNFLLTRPQPNIVATSISGDNLRDGLWKECAYWYSKSPLLQAAFNITTTRIESKQDPRNWFMSARTWPKSGTSEEQANSLAGFHAPYTLFLIDEAGGIPDSVMAAAEGALSTGIEVHMVIAGNPTHREGPLYRACTTEARLWRVVTISSDPDDPQRSTRVSAEWAREQIEKYGRDHPYVIVNVLGNWPPHSFNALIGDDEVAAAMKRMYRESDLGSYSRIIGIDVARLGDDQSVIARRHGLQAYPFIRRRNVESGQIGASLTNRIWGEFRADAAFIDGTGGFGLTWHDCLADLGRTTIPIGFAQKASQEQRYYNKRAEMYFELIQWIKSGGALPPEDADGSAEFKKALVNTTFTFKGDRLLLEEKDDIKAKIGFSPDEADALALTFAEPVSPRRQGIARVSYSAVSDYRPFAELDQSGGRSAVGDYNPFKFG